MTEQETSFYSGRGDGGGACSKQVSAPPNREFRRYRNTGPTELTFCVTVAADASGASRRKKLERTNLSVLKVLYFSAFMAYQCLNLALKQMVPDLGDCEHMREKNLFKIKILQRGFWSCRGKEQGLVIQRCLTI